LYATIEAEGGPWAPTALFARARLLAEQGRTAEARAALSRYLERYPRGPNADDARALLQR
jgi:TolA-binding protein